MSRGKDRSKLTQLKMDLRNTPGRVKQIIPKGRKPDGKTLCWKYDLCAIKPRCLKGKGKVYVPGRGNKYSFCQVFESEEYRNSRE